MLVRLIYCSRVRPTVSTLDVRSILTVSQRNNARDGITGGLVFTGGVFLQCLEGHRSAVNETYHRIAADPRHFDPAILSWEEVDTRQFSAWTMGYLGYTSDNSALFLKYAAGKEFDPYACRSSAIREMFTEVVANAKILKPTVD